MSDRFNVKRRFFQRGASQLVARAMGALAFSVAFSAATSAEARTIIVDLVGERVPGQVGQCSLREAVQAVNLNTSVQACPGPDGQPDVIQLNPATYTVTLATASSSLSLNRSVTIEGNGFEATTITTSSGGQSVALFKANTTGITFRGIKFYAVKGGEPIYVSSTGSVGFYDSHIVESGNSFNGNGCVYNQGAMTIQNVEISKCASWTTGAILNTGTLYMEATSVLESDASRNGAINNEGSTAKLFMYNSTIAKNIAPQHASALTNGSGSTAELMGVTIMDNTARIGVASEIPAIRNLGGTLKLKSSIVSRNRRAPAAHTPCSGTITSQGYNYLGETTEICAVTPAQSSDKTGSFPELFALKRVGGITRVMVPKSTFGNPILKMVSPDGCLSSDQRGLRRVNAGSNCEAGAANRGLAIIVIDNPSAPKTEDTKMVEWLADAGFDTFYLDDSNPAPFLGNPGETLAIISTTVDDATIGTKYKSTGIGVVVNKISALDNMGMVAANAYGTFSSTRFVAVQVNGERFQHKIGNFATLLNNGGGGWGTPAGTATWLVYYTENAKPCVFRYGKGVTGSGGFVFPAGRIAFPGWPSLFTGSGTADAKETFYEAVMWASRAK
jgi:hypothetical protein